MLFRSGLLKLSHFVPTKRTIIVCLEVFRVEVNCPRIILDSILVLTLLPVGETSIMIEISLSAFQLDRLSETSDCLFEVALPIETYAFIVECVRVARVDLNGSGVIMYSLVKLTDLIIGETSVEKGLEVRGQDLQSFAVELDR